MRETVRLQVSNVGLSKGRETCKEKGRNVKIDWNFAVQAATRDVDHYHESWVIMVGHGQPGIIIIIIPGMLLAQFIVLAALASAVVAARLDPGNQKQQPS